MDAGDTVPRFIAGALSGAPSGLFAFAGAFTGAAIGALACRASDSGILRVTGLGAIAGAVLSVEVFEASRAYWCLQQTGLRGSSSIVSLLDWQQLSLILMHYVALIWGMSVRCGYKGICLIRADFKEELFRERSVDELTPPLLTAYHWQVSVADINYDEILGIYGEAVSRGLPGDSLNRLPCHMMLDEIKETRSTVNCTICLRDIKLGEMVRSLP